jgi:hypothetical protein
METLSFAQMVVDRIKQDCRLVDTEERFAYSFDELYGNESFFENTHLSPARVLKECDPIAFSQAVNDYSDTDDTLIDIDGEYYNRDDVEEVKQQLIAEIENV